MPKLSGNKGEWSEIYAFLRLLEVKKLYAADAELNKKDDMFYNIINTRDLAGLPTVINTNLAMSEIASRYTPRVASRLIKYTAKKFIGSDIRQLKAIEKN